MRILELYDNGICKLFIDLPRVRRLKDIRKIIHTDGVHLRFLYATIDDKTSTKCETSNN